MVRRQPLRKLRMQLGQSPSLVEAAHRGNRRRRRLVRLAEMIGVVDLRQECEPLAARRGRLVEAATVERGLRSRSERERAELDAVERLGEPARLAQSFLRGTLEIRVGASEKRAYFCFRAVRRELERLRTPSPR